jgi:hypothetical protein
VSKRTLFSLYSLGSNKTKNHSRADSKLQSITRQNRNSFIKRYFFYQGFGKPELNSGHMYTIGNKITFQNSVMLTTVKWRKLRLKCDGTHAETRFRLSAKWTSPFKSAGVSIQSTTGSQGVRISGSNAGYAMFWGTVSPSPPLPVRHCLLSHFNWTLNLQCHKQKTGVRGRDREDIIFSVNYTYAFPISYANPTVIDTKMCVHLIHKFTAT